MRIFRTTLIAENVKKAIGALQDKLQASKHSLQPPATNRAQFWSCAKDFRKMAAILQEGSPPPISPKASRAKNRAHSQSHISIKVGKDHRDHLIQPISSFQVHPVVRHQKHSTEMQFTLKGICAMSKEKDFQGQSYI